MVDADCNRSESALAGGSAMLDGGEAPTAATEAPAAGAIDLNELLRSGQKLPPSARPPEPAGADGLEQQSWLQQLKMWAVAQSRLEETPMYQIKEQAFSEQLEREAEARRRQVLAQRKEYHRPMDFLQLERQTTEAARNGMMLEDVDVNDLMQRQEVLLRDAELLRAW